MIKREFFVVLVNFVRFPFIITITIFFRINLYPPPPPTVYNPLQKSHWPISSQKNSIKTKMPSAYTYLRELQKKKSSDVLRFLARIRMWQARMEPNIKKLTRPSRTEKARGLGYKRIPGMSIVRCAVRRGGRKRPNSKGIVYGKPKHQGITQLKFKRSLRSTAEERVGRVYANMRVLNSYWVGQVSLFNIRFFSLKILRVFYLL